MTFGEEVVLHLVVAPLPPLADSATNPCMRQILIVSENPPLHPTLQLWDSQEKHEPTLVKIIWEFSMLQ